ncbi:ATP-binding protein [Amycolatopsis sp. H20-H5]|uniref:ATP-binding protein n=1 Tax=Amycolatopsis sp. H20-H5 TaxID=3046309 RepID=UPI002DBCC80D|nr:ATP-binding protein [Amycolatopsis sp. H20-H5]MEC3979840.1 ATP-binding protein [Amycolatopsis sp. H20-H5]
MSTWHEQVAVSGAVALPPDPRAMEGLGRNHSLETALADLVDNSIDAQASEVLIRFVRRAGRLRALYMVDNGHGMGRNEIDTAMTVGSRRVYGRAELGRFGIGLKAASFSQARAVTVVSKTVSSSPVGRRWVLGDDRENFQCDIVSEDFCFDEYDRSWGIAESGSGTVVRWDVVSGFPTTDDPARVEKFITQAIAKIRNHLGLVLHRIIASGRIAVTVDVEDVDSIHPGPRFPVAAIDPFGYLRSGHADYPKTLAATSRGHKVEFACHIWPGRSHLPEFRLSGAPADHQGIYFYRNDRLLQAGGQWGGVHPDEPALQLARVAVDIDDDILGLFQMNPEKSRVITGPDFTALAESTRAGDGSGVADYLLDAQQAYRKSRQRSRSRKPMIPPGKGFPPRLRSVIEEEIPAVPGHEGLSVKWRRFENDSFFDVDRATGTLWLNQQYRPTPTGQRHTVNDTPLLKALLYLLIEDVFEGEHLGPKDKDNIELWQEVLTVAAKDEGTS